MNDGALPKRIWLDNLEGKPMGHILKPPKNFRPTVPRCCATCKHIKTVEQAIGGEILYCQREVQYTGIPFLPGNATVKVQRWDELSLYGNVCDYYARKQEAQGDE